MEVNFDVIYVKFSLPQYFNIVFICETIIKFTVFFTEKYKMI